MLRYFLILIMTLCLTSSKLISRAQAQDSAAPIQSQTAPINSQTPTIIIIIHSEGNNYCEEYVLVECCTCHHYHFGICYWRCEGWIYSPQYYCWYRIGCTPKWRIDRRPLRRICRSEQVTPTPYPQIPRPTQIQRPTPSQIPPQIPRPTQILRPAYPQIPHPTPQHQIPHNHRHRRR